MTKLMALFRDAEYRHAYVESFLNSYIATQIAVLREQQDLTQAELARRAEMRQSQISKLEDVNNSSWKISTLQRLARAFDLVLVVRFESFGSVLSDIDRFGRASLKRESFETDPVLKGR
jgi:transcriptional regulator with XRE-family HTH domain